jgi:hypothetical protein
MKFLKNLLEMTAVSLVLASGLALVNVQQSKAAGLTFLPTPDIDREVSIGDEITFELMFDPSSPSDVIDGPFGTSYEYNLTYDVAWDTEELALVPSGSKSLVGTDPSLEPFISNTKFFGDPILSPKYYQSFFSDSILVSPVAISSFTFKVLAGLNDDNSFDFATYPNMDGGEFKSVKVKPASQPVPTPALLPGLIGLGATIVRKKRESALA